MTVVSVEEAKAGLSRLIDGVLAGGEVIITHDAVPAARLVPITMPGRRRLGVLRGLIAVDARFGEPLSENELAAWEGE